MRQVLAGAILAIFVLSTAGLLGVINEMANNMSAAVWLGFVLVSVGGTLIGFAMLWALMWSLTVVLRK